MTTRLISLQIRFARLQISALSLFIIAQRSPALRFLSQLDSLVKSPFSRLLQVVGVVFGYTGATQALTGATTFTTVPTSPASAKVGEEFALAFSITGTPAPASSWEVLGTLPPGVVVENLNGSVLNSNLGRVTGTPTQAGTFEFTVQPFKGTNLTDITNGTQYQIRIVVADSQPPLDTTFVANPGSTLNIKRGEPIDGSFSIQGMDAKSWKVTGSLPAGVSLTGPQGEALQGNTLNAASGKLSGAPSVTGEFTISLQAFEQPNLGERGDPRSYAITINALALTSLESWKKAELGSISAPNDGDPDLDLLPNILEYALLLDPNQIDPGAPIGSRVIGNAEGSRLQIELVRDPARNDVVIELQSASSLAGPWSPLATSQDGAPFSGSATVSESDSEGGLVRAQIMDTEATTAETGRFVRVATRAE